MEIIFVLVTAIVSTAALMLSIGTNFSQTVEKMMDKEKMMKESDMTMDKKEQ